MPPLRFALFLAGLTATAFAAPARTLSAGAFAQDISPTTFPAPVNGSMKAGFANQITDLMHARALALHDGATTLILCVVDSCLIPREVCEAAKVIVAQATGVPTAHLLISATHSHSCAAMTPAFQSDPDPAYVASLPPRIAEAMIRAHRNLEPADVAWGKDRDPTQVFNRRWFMKPDQTYENPFGSTADRALMNPGYRNARVSEPSGPVDPEVYLIAARARADGRPLALLANYSLHYVGGLPAISADYFGAFANEIARRLGAGDARYAGKPAFVGIMSNGTSGNINNINYAAAAPARRAPGEQISVVANSVADAALRAWDRLAWHSELTLAASERDVPLGVRKATPAELAQARQIVTTTPRDKDGQFSDRKAIYAREALALASYPDQVPVKLQAHRIGRLTVAAIPCEVFVEIGLDLKATRPLDDHFTISLANGYNGYLPTPEHHRLGGYETWRARSSYLETDAATTITRHLKELLADVAK
jgi:neutral ceramidase